MEARPPGAPGALPRSTSSSAPSVGRVPRRAHDGATTEDDGALPEGVTVFDDDYPGVANLDPGLRQALREAATDAADDGISLFVNSGWRSRAYQGRLLRLAIAEYGSAEEAARWVGTADTSAHVSGDAVDIGPFDATAWLSEHGAEYGLCQVYRNEPWHYELRPEAIDHGCPRMYADPTHDPRMQQ
jgi:D-alanyl-D-alanine carboxypeptidase